MIINELSCASPDRFHVMDEDCPWPFSSYRYGDDCSRRAENSTTITDEPLNVTSTCWRAAAILPRWPTFYHVILVRCRLDFVFVALNIFCFSLPLSLTMAHFLMGFRKVMKSLRRRLLVLLSFMMNLIHSRRCTSSLSVQRRFQGDVRGRNGLR